jgi:hypothetical protein
MDGLLGGRENMATIQDYQQRAVECLRLARSARNPGNKALFLEMAQTWVKLAEQAQAREIQAQPVLVRFAEMRTAVGQGG